MISFFQVILVDKSKQEPADKKNGTGYVFILAT